MKLILLWFAIFSGYFCISFVNAQVFEEWVRQYDGPSSMIDIAYSIITDDSGNVYVAGTSENGYAIIKYNSMGSTKWVARYDSLGVYPPSIAVDDSGNVYLEGTVNNDYLTIKYNSTGLQKWMKIYGGYMVYPFNYPSRPIAVDKARYIYTTGAKLDTSGTGLDIATIKYNSSGIQQWEAIYDQKKWDEAYAIAVDDSGNVYVSGYIGDGTDNGDYITIKYDSLGVQQWSVTYNGVGEYDVALYIKIDNTGNVYVSGRSEVYVSSFQYFDYVTIKYNSNGVQQWISRYNGLGNGHDEVHGLVLDDSANVYITGASKGITSGSDYATIKYNSNGIEQWVARYSQVVGSIDESQSIVIDQFGNVYVTGVSDTGATPNYVTIKYNSLGIEQGIMSYNGIANVSDVAYSLTLDKSGNIFVTGVSDNSNFVTIKYSQPGWGINDYPQEKESKVKIYPNPFTDKATIRITNTEQGIKNYEVKIYDLLGREVKQFKMQNSQYTINRDNLPSGMYLYKVTDKQKIIATGKIIIQ